VNEKSAERKEELKQAKNSNSSVTSKKKGKKKKNARLHLLNERFGRLVYFWHQNFVDNVDDTVCVHHICFDDGGFPYLKKKKLK
jgi:hypothetical protein